MDVAVRNLVKRFGDFTAVNQVNFTIPSGRCLALLGPSGCGKTTTLNIIAGFLDPDGGEVLVGDRSLAGTPPHKRNVGMVFQNYALFPHLTTFDNVAYGLRQRKVQPGEIKKAVDTALAMVRLEGLAHRYPRQLSGGQQQRVALARAIVIQPDILLLDEPLSNLDAKLRDAMRIELKQIQNSSRITTVFVTHDQAEAMVLADQIAVMNQGRVEQLAAPQEIYNRPATRFVAEFVGRANFLRGVVEQPEGGHATLRVPGADHPVRVASGLAAAAVGQECEVLVRPERMQLLTEPDGNANLLRARVKELAFTGPQVDCFLDWGGQTILVEYTSGMRHVEPGQEVWISWRPDDGYALGGGTR